jgi:hypothetical protein
MTALFQVWCEDEGENLTVLCDHEGWYCRSLVGVGSLDLDSPGRHSAKERKRKHLHLKQREMGQLHPMSSGDQRTRKGRAIQVQLDTCFQ